MPFTIPQIETPPTFDGQSVPDTCDWIQIVAGQLRNASVIFGCGVTPGTGMAVNIAAGACIIGGQVVPVAAQNNIAVSAASATDRKDSVYVDTSGIAHVLAGTPCGTAGWTRSSTGLPPVKPLFGAGCIIGEIYVAFNTTSIATANLTDKSWWLGQPTPVYRQLATGPYTMNPGEFLYTTQTGAMTVTLPSGPPRSTPCKITNAGTGNLTISRGGVSDTIQHYATTGLTSFIIPPGMSVELMYQPTAWSTLGGGFSPGYTISYTRYGPGTSALYALSGTVGTVIDATNLTFSFIAPPNGSVLIEVSGYWTVAASAQGTGCVLMGLRDHTALTQVGARMRVHAISGSASSAAVSMEGRSINYFNITGLTAGTTYQYDLCGWWQLLAGSNNPSANHYCDDGITGANYLGHTHFVVKAT